MDWRILIVLSPLLIAAGWAGFNIAAVALRQVQQFMSRET